MTKSELIAKLDLKARPFIARLNPQIVSKFYSSGRKLFINILANDKPSRKIHLDKSNRIILWDIEFNTPLFNAAGMFKKGEGYYAMAAQGAGAYLAGTTTSSYRRGNEKSGILHPFMPYPYSDSASNWMGLPNEGHDTVAKRLSKIEKIEGCPIGASLSLSPGTVETTALNELITGFNQYEKANVDFLELNESCPNVDHGHDCELVNGIDKNLTGRLEFVNQNYIRKRKRNIPLILKLSNDTDPILIPKLIDILIDYGFSGINLGNTSTDYTNLREKIAETDINKYNYFIKNFGGGLSGNVLKEKSLLLCKIASNYIADKSLSQEFHVIRTGGIDSPEDLDESKINGIELNQWFTGYFKQFSLYGHELYSKMLRSN